MKTRNAAYFAKAHMFMPIIHPSRYFQFFYSAPHKRPPMCLQYAMWTLASSGHEKYSHYHDIFYKRARQYADGDEMRVGESTSLLFRNQAHNIRDTGSIFSL